jgi:hypothetical protein
LHGGEMQRTEMLEPPHSEKPSLVFTRQFEPTVWSCGKVSFGREDAGMLFLDARECGGFPSITVLALFPCIPEVY